MYNRDGIKKTLYEINEEYPGFNKQEFLEIVKKAVIRLYYGIKQESLKDIPLQVEKKLVNKILLNKEKYRINDYIDTISIQFIEVRGFVKEDNNNYIKLYLSVYFYDNSRNNSDNKYEEDKYWYDIWNVTISEADKLKTSNCSNCGAIMNYNAEKDLLECNYCNNTLSYALKAKWKIVDIEVEEN